MRVSEIFPDALSGRESGKNTTLKGATRPANASANKKVARLSKGKRTPFPQEFKDYIQRMLIYLQREMGHREYDFDVAFHHEDTVPIKGYGQVNAEIAVDDVYLNYVLRVYPVNFERWKSKDFQSVGATMCHELAHMLTHPLTKMLREDASPSRLDLIWQVNERQTQRICNIVWANLPSGWYEPEKLLKLNEAYSLNPEQVQLVTRKGQR